MSFVIDNKYRTAHSNVMYRLQDVSLLERCLGVMYRLQWSWDLKICPYLKGVIISEGVHYTGEGMIREV